MNPTFRRCLPALPLLVFLALAAPTARAQGVRPWLPANADSLTLFARPARAAFQQVQGDSALGPNYTGYERTSELARWLFSRLGRDGMLQGAAVEAVMDSLGLDTDVRVDAESPGIAFVLVRNPYRPGADAVGYLLWWRASQLRMQGATFPAARRPRFRAWWAGAKDAPYEAAVLFDQRRDAGEIGVRLFRLAPNGTVWSLAQAEDDLRLGTGEAVFVDPNGDSRPEIVAWTKVEPDSFLAIASGAPGLLNESLWVEREQGYLLQDLRLLPSPVATFSLFVRQLVAGHRDAAARLLANPETIAEAARLGWPLRRARGAWTVEYGETGEAWPEWIAVRESAPDGVRRWIFHFRLDGGRWQIREWLRVKPAPQPENTPVVPGRGAKR